MRATGAGEDSSRRCHMMPNVAICVHCSSKVKEMEKSVNVPPVPGAVAHLACAQKITVRADSPDVTSATR